MYEKIVIIGQAGAGKSTLAQKLGSLLSMEIIHLDRYFWEPNWVEKSRDMRIEIMQELVQREKWIMEGSYLGSSDSRLNAADTIIFLDMPSYLCLWRVIRRYFQYKKEPRPDLPQGCPEKLSFRYILKVLTFPLRGRHLLFKKMEEINRRVANEPEFPKKIIHILRSRAEVENFLCMLSASKKHTCIKKANRFAKPYLP